MTASQPSPLREQKLKPPLHGTSVRLNASSSTPLCTTAATKNRASASGVRQWFKRRNVERTRESVGRLSGAQLLPAEQGKFGGDSDLIGEDNNITLFSGSKPRISRRYNYELSTPTL